MIANILTYLTLAFSFELSAEVSQWLLWDYANPEFNARHNMYIGFKPDVELRYGDADVFMYVGGQMYNGSKIENIKQGAGGFNPMLDNYMFRLGITYYGFTIGYEHDCTHPITTYNLYDEEISWKSEGAYNKYFVKYTGEIRGGKRK